MSQTRPGQQVVVLGAGMVGIGCALALQQRGLQVTVLDPLGAGAATSHGNAGVLSRSSLLPFNHPGLWAQLPSLLRGRTPGFRFDRRWLLSQWRWGLAFMRHARRDACDTSSTALDGLIRLSGDLHRAWMQAAGVAHRRRDEGWLLLYRSESGYTSAGPGRQTLARFGVLTTELNAHALHDLEPQLKPIFPHALWVQEASSVDNPGAVVRAYAHWLQMLGGQLIQAEALQLQPNPSGWSISLADGSSRQADHVVLALGPWSRDFMKRQLGLHLPLGFERGYHRHFHLDNGLTLKRPVCDTAAVSGWPPHLDSPS
jgi:D-amino-acid dehydrogenase